MIGLIVWSYKLKNVEILGLDDDKALCNLKYTCIYMFYLISPKHSNISEPYVLRCWDQNECNSVNSVWRTTILNVKQNNVNFDLRAWSTLPMQYFVIFQDGLVSGVYTCRLVNTTKHAVYVLFDNNF
jgi:hypothetical protein